MNPRAELDYGEDEILLQDMVRKTLAAASPARALAAGADDPAAIGRRHWALAADMGWPGLLIPNDQGGAGFGCRELAIVAEEMGAHLFCGPFLSTAVLGAAIAGAAAAQGRMPELGAAIAGGQTILSAAHLPESCEWLETSTTLSVDGSSPPRVSGVRELVEHPALATHFLALDMTENDAGDVNMLAALVPAGPSVKITSRRSFDVSCPIGTLRFHAAPVAPENLFYTTLSRAATEALLRPVHIAIAAELVGVAQASLDKAVAHAKDRHQFDKPIGSFQAIKHRLSDAFVLVANARLTVRHAASDSADISAVHCARVLAADAALKAAGDCVQVQGGMGFSWESDAHLYLKRARRLAATFGSSQSFRRAIANRFIDSVLAASPAG